MTAQARNWPAMALEQLTVKPPPSDQERGGEENTESDEKREFPNGNYTESFSGLKHRGIASNEAIHDEPAH